MIQRWMNGWIISILEDAINKLKDGTFNLTDDEMNKLFDALNFRIMNKVESAKFVRLSEKQFENKVSNGIIPKGRKLIEGDSKFYWNRRDLILYIKQCNGRTR